MVQENPFENMFDQIAKLLQTLESKVGTPIDEIKITPEVMQRLAKIEKDVKEFTRLGEELVKLSNVPPEEIKKRLAGKSDQVAGDEKAFIAKSKNLHDRASQLIKKFAAGTALPEEKPAAEKIDNEAFRKRRRRKFKHFDGDQA